jgi:hypothetical protein
LEATVNNRRTVVWTTAGALTLVIMLMAVTGVWAESPKTDLAVPSAPLAVFSDTVSFQGRLLDNAGNPVDGFPIMTFRLYAQAEGGAPVWEDAYNVPVESGLFNAGLEIPPSLFDGQALWLGVQVAGDAQEMQPRQQLLPVPYALYAKSAANAGSGAEAWLLGGNTGTTSGTDVLGTTDAAGLTLVVNAVPALRLEPATVPNFIGGYRGNSVTNGVYGATIGGGGQSGYPNRVTAYYGTIGGGYGNVASGQAATIGGGQGNAASGTWASVSGGPNNTASGNYGTIGGGIGNVVSGTWATISGGDNNTACGVDATVGGGNGNTASGEYATIPGGSSSSAEGDYSFAAGRRARAVADGCFAWGDSTDATFNCSNPNRFMVRASGGGYLYTNATVSTGAYLPPNTGSWSSLSDRNVKENLESVDPEYVLEQAAQMSVSTWNYIGEAEGIRHLGPMAQDFTAAFGLGDSERYINTIDADGVALAAIQGLYAKNQALEAENAALQTQIDDLETRLTALEHAGTPQPVSTLTTWWPLAGLAILAGIAVARRRQPRLER